MTNKGNVNNHKPMKKLKALFYPDVNFESLFIPHIYREIYFDKIYADVFVNKQPGSMTIMDVGANIGIVTQFMQPYAKKLYAIEPSSEHFEALAKNKEFNNWDNVKIFKVALANKDGETELLKKPDNRTMDSIVMGKRSPDGSLVFPMRTRHPHGDPEVVKTMTMDTFFKENKITEVDFIKFDVEGAEDMILRSEGFKKVASRIKNIEIEFHFPDWQNLVGLLVGLGFRARQYKCSAIVFLFSR